MISLIVTNHCDQILMTEVFFILWTFSTTAVGVCPLINRAVRFFLSGLSEIWVTLRNIRHHLVNVILIQLGKDLTKIRHEASKFIYGLSFPRTFSNFSKLELS